MSIYSKYLFINPPNGCDPQKTSDEIEFSQFPTIEQFADLFEMWMRRNLIQFLSSHTSGVSPELLTEEQVRDAYISTRQTISGFLDANYRIQGATPPPLIKKKIPDGMSVAEADAKDKNESFSGYIPGNYLFRTSQAKAITITDLIREIYNEVFQEYAVAFLDPQWSPDNWEAEASDDVSAEFNGLGTDNPVDPTACTPSSRYELPSKSFFTSIYDAKFARPLKEPVPYKPSADEEPISLAIPPYFQWVDPTSSDVYFEWKGRKINAYNGFQGGSFGRIHELFGFEYDPDADLPDYQRVTSNTSKLDCLDSPSNGLAIEGYHTLKCIVPRLNTDKSWWEDNNLSDIDLLECCPNKVREAMQSFYVPPAPFPALTEFGCFPPSSDWAASNNTKPPRMPIPPFHYLMVGTLKQTALLLKKLCKSVIQIFDYRISFNASSEYTKTTTETYSSDPQRVNEISHFNSYSGWSEAGAGASCQIGSICDLPTLAPSSDLNDNGTIEKCEREYTETTVGLDWTSWSKINITGAASSSATISSIIPLGRDNVYPSYQYHKTEKLISNGTVITDIDRDESHGDGALYPRIPKWAMPFVKKAELFAHYEGSLYSTLGESGTVTRTGDVISGGRVLSRLTKKTRKVLKLGTYENKNGNDDYIEFKFKPDLDMHSLLSSVIGNGELDATIVGSTGSESYTLASGTITETFDYNKCIDHRELSLKGLFMVIDWDPDANISWPWDQH